MEGNEMKGRRKIFTEKQREEIENKINLILPSISDEKLEKIRKIIIDKEDEQNKTIEKKAKSNNWGR